MAKPRALSLDEERRVWLARLCEAIGGGKPPVLANPPFHLYPGEWRFAVRQTQRWEYFGAKSGAAAAGYTCFGRPLFRPGGLTGLVYIAPPPGPAQSIASPDWRPAGKGWLHLTNWRSTFQSEEGDWIDIPFDTVEWSDCFAQGIGIHASGMSPMYFLSPYPEWTYALFCYLAHGEVPQVPLARELDMRARTLGL